MAAIDYDALGLPCPQTSTVTPAERRALSDSERPRDARNIQRDRLEFERITWPPMNATQCDTLLTWWRTTLIYGGAWFSATWPLPRGLVSAVRKLREQPRWAYVAGGYWRLSALCEVRGRGEIPAERDQNTLLLMHMDGPEDSMTLIDELGNDGFVSENPDGPPGDFSGIIITNVQDIIEPGCLYLAPYYGPGAFYIVSAIIPARASYGVVGPFTIEFTHQPGSYRNELNGAELLVASEITEVDADGEWGFSKLVNGDLRFWVYENGFPEAIALSAAWPAGETVHIAGTRDASGHLRLFINGVLQDTSIAQSVSTLTDSRQIIMGGSRYQAAVNNFADGLYDELRISNICRYTANYTPTFPFPNP